MKHKVPLPVIDTHATVRNSVNHGSALSCARRCRTMHYVWIPFTKYSQNGILVLTKSRRKPIFRIEVYRRIILQCNGSWTPYIDGLLTHMMFDENNYFSLQWKLEIYSN